MILTPDFQLNHTALEIYGAPHVRNQTLPHMAVGPAVHLSLLLGLDSYLSDDCLCPSLDISQWQFSSSSSQSLAACTDCGQGMLNAIAGNSPGDTVITDLIADFLFHVLK